MAGLVTSASWWPWGGGDDEEDKPFERLPDHIARLEAQQRAEAYTGGYQYPSQDVKPWNPYTDVRSINDVLRDIADADYRTYVDEYRESAADTLAKLQAKRDDALRSAGGSAGAAAAAYRENVDGFTGSVDLYKQLTANTAAAQDAAIRELIDMDGDAELLARMEAANAEDFGLGAELEAIAGDLDIGTNTVGLGGMTGDAADLLAMGQAIAELSGTELGELQRINNEYTNDQAEVTGKIRDYRYMDADDELARFIAAEQERLRRAQAAAAAAKQRARDNYERELAALDLNYDEAGLLTPPVTYKDWYDGMMDERDREALDAELADTIARADYFDKVTSGYYSDAEIAATLEDPVARQWLAEATGTFYNPNEGLQALAEYVNSGDPALMGALLGYVRDGNDQLRD